MSKFDPKPPTRGLELKIPPLLGGYFACASLVLYGRRELAQQFLGSNFDIEVDHSDCLSSGGYDGENVSNNILRFNPAEEVWEKVGQMRDARIFHAVAVLEDVSYLCP